MTDPRTLWDWRRRVADMYAAVRAAPDPEAAWQRWRTVRDGLFHVHSQTPLDLGAEAPEYFPYDPAFRFVVSLAPHDAPEQAFPAGADGELRMRPFARTAGLASALGGELTLYWMQGYAGGTFLPFADATSGRGTYGGGRYLLDTAKGADLGILPDGRTVLDFNFAFNPSCAYSPRWTCPLAPMENRLSAAVAAGERIAL